MKRALLIGLTIVLVVSLAACAPKGAPTETGATSGSPLAEDYENALPVLSQVMVGTFKLEEGDKAVTATQAAELATLWKAYRGMSTSDSVSKVELDALLEQILEFMTDEQLAAIADMQLTREDLTAVMQEQGVELGAGGRTGNFSPEQIEAMEPRLAQGGGGGGGGFGGGGGPGGPPGGFGGAPGGGQAPNPEQIAALQAQHGGGGAGGFMVQGPLFDALIKLLESKE